MDHTETMAALSVHGRRNRTEAETHRRQAAETKTNAEAYAAQHVGDAMAGKRAQIMAEAESTSQSHLETAKLHDDRASAAEKGYLLHRSGVECRDPHYAMEHQSLIAAAGRHGLLVDQVTQ
jgi:hypothetical protein